jgi:hypothetical protein
MKRHTNRIMANINRQGDNIAYFNMILMFICAFTFVYYVTAFMSITKSGITINSLDNSLVSLSEQVVDLEREFVNLKAKISSTAAINSGLHEVSAPRYIVRKTTVGLSLNNEF